MSSKIVLGLFIFFLLAAVGAYLAINRGLIFPSASKNSRATLPPAESFADVAVRKKDNGYILHGRLAGDLELNSAGNIEGRFILLGDPDQREIKLLIIPEEGVVSVAEYTGSFAGNLFVERLDPTTFLMKIKSGDQVEFNMLIPTDRDLKPYETMMKEALDNLASGSWEIPTSDAFIVITGGAGIIQ